MTGRMGFLTGEGFEGAGRERGRMSWSSPVRRASMRPEA